MAPQLIHSELQNPCCTVAGGATFRKGHSYFCRVFARFEVGGEHHRTRVVQSATVPVGQIHAFVVAAVDADLQHTGIRPGKYVGPDRVAFELDRYLAAGLVCTCLLYTSPSPRDRTRSRMPSSA